MESVQVEPVRATKIPSLLGVRMPDLLTLSSDASVLEATRLMKEHGVGDIIITEDIEGELFPVGILTDRDLALKAISFSAPAESLKVSEVMSKFLVTCPESADVFEMIRIMKEEGICRLPLVSPTGTLKKIVNAKNLIQLLVESLNDLAHISVRQEQKEKCRTH